MEDAWAYVLCVTFERVKRQYISFTYVRMYMCMYVCTLTRTHTFMHMYVNPTLQCTAARTGKGHFLVFVSGYLVQSGQRLQ